MIMNKKAQAAMEFLMTYGWAILVVLIAIGALAYFGVLNPDRFLPEKCVISTGSGLFCDEHAATNDQVQLVLHNILTETITVSEITLTQGTDDCIHTFTSGNTIDADGTTTFTVVGDTGDLCDWIDAGDKVKADVKIEYSVGTGGLTKYTSGTLVTTAG